MKLKLGVVGADDSLAVIQSVVTQFSEIEYLPIVYWKEEELYTLLPPRLEEADMWLFSGQVPYALAKEWGITDKPMAYVPHIGASLYRTLFSLSHQDKLAVEQLSFDTFRPEELKQIMAEANIHSQPRYLKSYEGAITASELAEFHYQLWKSGKTKAAVTCLRTAHLELQRLGVPVYRVLPTYSGVQSVINMLLRTHEMYRFKDTQIAVLLLEIDSFRGLINKTFSTDELHKLEIKATEKLLAFTKQLQGSLKLAGPGRYVIFTTRGILREMTNQFTSIPDLEGQYGIGNQLVTCGIGIGKSAYEAEIHAGNALLHAKEFGTGTWMAFFDDKTIVGPLGKQEQISFSVSTKQLQALSKKTSLSVMTLSKLNSILHKLGRTELNAHELAQYMGILPRSARRILMELEANGLAEVIGEESPHSRGRPRKLYRLLFPS
ncbi:ArsR family transcriptional regulator [Brevibacillus fulvus]|uniref:Transcriptional regulator n=1 Tax=Brevibacillus fulvus TaxID=1125967 RepID=A0A939BNW0_9BACL|nr:ArsR family transcriptional regulator [Brevibacillus fulvus]MBM7589710.1 hypothetical protein [Brevibacillus fulvus]